MPALIHCADCGTAYPGEGMPYRCRICGGLYMYAPPAGFSPKDADRAQPGIWKYRRTFGIDPPSEPVSLGEGNTPLVWADGFGRKIAFKCEYLNPSGSFKDRGSAVITGWLKARKVMEAIEDSSGNAGASFAAYAARAGIKATIIIPGSASGPKRRQIEMYGAKLVSIEGSRSEVAQAALKLAEDGAVYASHAYLPFNIPGYATTAYEIYEQLGRKIPGAIVLPAGQGGLLLGLDYGLTNLRTATGDQQQTRMVAVQASANAPLWALFEGKKNHPTSVKTNSTLAEGVNVRDPIRANEVILAVRKSGGAIVPVEEKDILPGRERLAQLGFYVEPTSAIVWPALEKIIEELPDPIVVILTGSGYKYE